MALPQLKTATYLTKVPSTGKEVEFRPYTVKEEKVLMIAQESKDMKQAFRALKSVIKDCVNDINIEKLTMFDFEYLFLQLRSKSVGEVVDLQMKCQCNKECNAVTPVQVDLDAIEVSDLPESNNIQLDDKIGITFNFPSLTIAEKYNGAKEPGVKEVFDMIVDCTESIYDDEEVYDCKNEKRETVYSFFESLSSQQFKKVSEYFQKMPTVQHTIKYKCVECEKEQEVELRGLQSFFT